VAVTPYLDDPDPPPLLQSIPDMLHSSARVARPAVRRSYLERGAGADPHLRGVDPFVEVEWDFALDMVAGELERVKATYGNAAIFGGSYGWSSAGRFHHAKTQLARFLSLFGGYTGQIGNYSYAAGMQVLPHIVGDAAMVSGLNTSWDVIQGNTRLWVMLGGAPIRNSQVEAGGVVHHETAGHLRDVRSAGTEFILVSPIRDDVPADLGAEWLAIRPNTDTALLLGLAHTLLVEGLHDEQFLARHCVGWPTFREYLLGGDGQVKSAAWAAEICELSAERILALARQMATTRTMISATWSLQRAEHGEQPYWALIALAAMLGQIGLPGGGFGFAYGNASTIGGRRQPFSGPSLPTGGNPADSWIPVARIADMLLDPGGAYDFDGARHTYPDVRLVYWAGGNPFHHHQDLNRLVQAWQRPESIIVHEPFWTATARRADIVLPATTTLERNDIGASPRDRFIMAMHRAVEPVGDARDDFAIFSALAERLGFAEAFTQNRDDMTWIRQLYDETRARAHAAGTAMPDFDEFWNTGHVELPRRTGLVLLEDFRRDPDGHPLATPSGRIEIFSETVASFGYADCPGHPAWIPPQEWLGSPAAATFPLHLMSNQPRTRLHSQLDMGVVSRDSKVAGREPCRLNPEDAAQRGIAHGDLIRVFNDRGECLAGAILDDAVRTGVLQLSTGAWYDPVDPGTPGSLDRHGNPNVLTADHGTSRLAQGPSAHSALVDVERYDGGPTAVTVHSVPALQSPGDPPSTV
jgi:biotin/methionine sulfoxide reductase